MSATTLVATRTDTGERVTIGDSPLELLRVLSAERRLSCTQCGGLLLLKAGPVRLHHFAHVSVAQCDSQDHEPETDEHRQGKLCLYKRFRDGATLATVEQYLPATDQRADVLITLVNRRYALEFQQANNSVERWLERHRLYQSQSIDDIWFLGQVRYGELASRPPRAISPYDPLPVPRDVFGAVSGEFRIRELEKAILSTNSTLIYLDPATEMLTILLARDLQREIVHRNSLRAYRYQFALADCRLRDGRLWTPLDPLLDDYRRYLGERAI